MKMNADNLFDYFNFSVLNLIEKTSGVIGKKIEYKIVNNQKNEIPEQSLNFDKAGRVLGWKPAYAFADGVKQTYEWYARLFSL